MSIVKIRSLFEKKGCQVLTFIVMFFVAVGLLYTGTCSGLFSGKGEAGEGGATSVVVTVSGEPVLAQDVLDAEANLRKQNPTMGDPRMEFYLTVRALDESMTMAATSILAKKKGVVVDEATVTSIFNKQFQDSIAGAKMQYIQQGKLKAAATDADFVAEFKKETGKTPDEMKAANLADLLAKFKGPEGAQIKKGVAGLALANSYEQATTVTIEDVKRQFETFNIKRLSFNDPKMKPDERKAAAQKALDEIKGGLKFDEALAKYGKGQMSKPIGYSRMIIELNEPLKPLLDMKPGGVSEVMEDFSGSTLYYLVDIKLQLPADFDKNKDQYLKTFKGQMTNQAMTKELEALKQDSALKWSSEACQLAFQVYVQDRDGAKIGREKVNANMKDLAAKLANVKAVDGLGQKLKILGRYSAFEAYFLSTPPDLQKPLLVERSEVLQEATTITESTTLRLAIYDNYVKMGDFESAGDALLEAARANAGIDPQSVTANSSIVSKLTAAKKDGKVNKETLEAVDKEIERWKKEREAEEKQASEGAKANSGVEDELKKLDEAAPSKPDETKAGTPGKK